MSAPLSDEEYKKQVLADINDDGTVARSIDRIWRMYADWARYTTEDGRYSLQYLQVRAHALFVLMGSVRWQVTFAAKDRRVQLSDLFNFLKAMREDTLSEIQRSVAVMLVTPDPVVDQCTVTLPNLDSPVGWPDADDTVYSGDPNRRWWVPTKVQPD